MKKLSILITMIIALQSCSKQEIYPTLDGKIYAKICYEREFPSNTSYSRKYIIDMITMHDDRESGSCTQEHKILFLYSNNYYQLNSEITIDGSDSTSQLD